MRENRWMITTNIDDISDSTTRCIKDMTANHVWFARTKKQVLHISSWSGKGGYRMEGRVTRNKFHHSQPTVWRPEDEIFRFNSTSITPSIYHRYPEAWRQDIQSFFLEKRQCFRQLTRFVPSEWVWAKRRFDGQNYCQKHETLQETIV